MRVRSVVVWGVLASGVFLALAGMANAADSTAAEIADETAQAVSSWFSPEVQKQLLNTLLLILVVLFGRRLVIRRINQSGNGRPTELRRRLIVAVQNTSLLLILFGLIIIWATELRTLALSLFAVTAAIVLATKELILCISGGIYRLISKNCKIGDRIEVNNLRGDVIDQGLFHTTILEIGPGQLTQQHTGRAVVLPNAIFLNSPVINETYTQEYVAHTFSVPLTAGDNWRRAEQLLLDACQAEVGEFIEEAKRYIKQLQDEHGLAAPAADPRVFVKVPEAGKIMLVVRVPTPARRKGRIEQGIMRRFLTEFYRKDEDKKPGE